MEGSLGDDGNDENVICLLFCFVRTIADQNLLLGDMLGDAGVANPLVEVLKTHLPSAAVMKQACWALKKVAVNGK